MKTVEDAKTPAAKILVVEDQTPVVIMAFLLHRAAFAGSVTVPAIPSLSVEGTNHL